MRLDTNVARWAVTVIELSRTKRHLDRAALMVFWEHLDKYVLVVYIHTYMYTYMSTYLFIEPSNTHIILQLLYLVSYFLQAYD